MAGISTEKKAINFIKLLKQSGETVKTVTIKGKEIQVQLVGSDNPIDDFDLVDFKK